MSKAAKRKASRRGTKRVRSREELEIKSTLAAIQEEQEEAGGRDDTDCVLRHIPIQIQWRAKSIHTAMSHTMTVISQKQPLRHLLLKQINAPQRRSDNAKPVTIGRLGSWALMDCRSQRRI
jgi:hypothetical protein